MSSEQHKHSDQSGLSLDCSECSCNTKENTHFIMSSYFDNLLCSNRGILHLILHGRDKAINLGALISFKIGGQKKKDSLNLISISLIFYQFGKS